VIFELGCLRYLGRLAELRQTLGRARRDALVRGDRYLDITATLSAGIATVLVDGGEAALAELAALDTSTELAQWGPNVWYHARARAEADLQRDAPADVLRAHALTMQRMARTPSGFVAMWRAEMPWLEARLWLACAAGGDLSGLRRAARIARRLSAGSLPYEQIWGGLIVAALHARSGAVIDACTVLQRTAALAELHGYALCEAAARVRFASLSGERGADASARAYLEAEGVHDLDGVLRVVAPGFASSPALRAPRVPELPAETMR
jgi:hypothetical protein